jgi:hypothetical protein
VWKSTSNSDVFRYSKCGVNCNACAVSGGPKLCFSSAIGGPHLGSSQNGTKREGGGRKRGDLKLIVNSDYSCCQIILEDEKVK